MEDPAIAVEKLVDQNVMEVVSDKEDPIYIVSWNPQFYNNTTKTIFYQNWSLKYFRGVKYSVVLRLIGPIFKSWSPLSF